MKYIPEKHDKFKTRNSNYRIGKTTYSLKYCKNCKELCLIVKDGNYCTRSCAGEVRSGENHPFYGKHHTEKTKRKMSERRKENIHSWKGGVTAKNIPLYSTYGSQLEKYEKEIRENEKGFLEIKCAYCGRWYQPTRSEVRSRISCINGKNRGEVRIYCSKECKTNCPTYRQVKYPKGFKIATSREVQPELRKMRFELDDYKCQKCHSTDNLHCHHYEGIWINPVESADLDMCITLCKKCHKEVHKLPGCSYYDLRRCI